MRREPAIPAAVSALILSIAAVVTLSVLAVFVWIDLRDAEQHFVERFDAQRRILAERLNDNEAVLSGMAALLGAVHTAEQDRLAVYNRQMLEAYPHVRALAFLARVDAEGRDQLEARMRAWGVERFRVMERAAASDQGWRPSTERRAYYPVIFVRSRDQAVYRLGFDLASDSRVSQALHRAVMEDHSVISPPFPLPGRGRAVLVFKPVPNGSGPSGADDGSSAHHVAVLEIGGDRLLGVLGADATEWSIRQLGSAATGPGPILFHRAREQGSGVEWLPRFSRRSVVREGGQSLVLEAWQRPGWGVVRLHTLIGVFSTCLLVTALLLYAVRGRYGSAAARQRAREELYRERERALVTLQSIADGVVTTDVNGRVEYLNPVAERLTGWKTDEARGRPVDEVVHLVDEGADTTIENPTGQCVREGVAVNFGTEICLVNRDGKRYAIAESVTPIRDSDGSILGTALVFQDMGEAREMSRRLAYQASHDDLTDLVNRREFERRVQNAIETAGADGRQHVLFYLDLDRFKVVNDTCGHLAGDALVRQLAELLVTHSGPTDTLARLGGDEFGVLLEDSTLGAALSTAHHLVDAVKRFRFLWERKTFEVGLSIGVVQISSQYQTSSEIMRHADSACYIAKEKGGNRVHVYQPDDDALIRRQGEMQWVHRITQAYSESRFVLFAQEIVPLRDARPREGRHYEILLRMHDEKGQLILPMEYISAAERYNMMVDLDRWVMNNAFRSIQRYVESHRDGADIPFIRFGINLSGQSLGDDRALAYVQRLIKQFPGIAPHLVFEITETAAVTNLNQAVQFINAFRELGCGFALDDFGSGLSSFGYLKSLPVDYLKVDGELVKEIGYDPVNYAMVGSINHIGHVMRLKTIAEFVEDADTLEKLKELGVDFGQGRGLSEPVSLDELIEASTAVG